MGTTVSLAQEDARRRIDETLKANAARPLFTGTAVSFCALKYWPAANMHQQEAAAVLPHVYTSWSNLGGGSVLSQYGSKYMLPIGTTRQDYDVSFGEFISVQPVLYVLQDYEEVIIPPAKTVPPRESERLIPVSELDELARGSFPVRDFPYPNQSLFNTKSTRDIRL